MPEEATQQKSPEESKVERLQGNYSLFTSRAIRVLEAGKPGDLIRRDDMAKHVGASCETGDKGYASVNTAIRHCERLGKVWRWSRPDQGWKCYDDAESAKLGTRYVKSAHKKVNRALRVAATVDPKKLSDEDRREHNLNCVLLGTMRVMSHGGTRKKLAEANGSLAEPDIKRITELMKK